mmetsp:Transcript_14574/g.33814  ORF Transcript_14574/g.33814 Transcript_14574/m.33814 type:complete len:206 (-) Transcript_14574:432-1049(-)
MAMISPSILHDHGDSVTTAHGSYNASNLFSRLIHASKRTTSRPNTFFSAVLTTIIAIVEPATTLVVGPRKTIINTIILNFFRAADVRIFPATGLSNVAVVAAVFSVAFAAAEQTITNFGATHLSATGSHTLVAVGRGDSCLVVLPLRVVAITAVAGEIDVERAAVVGVEGDLGRVLRSRNLARVLLGTLEVDAGQGTHARLGVIR